MSSSTDSFDNVINVESSKVTRTASGSAGDMSRYAWVDPRILNIPTCFRDSNALDKILSKVAFLKPDTPSDALMAVVIPTKSGMVEKTHPMITFLCIIPFFLIYPLPSPSMTLPLGFFKSLMWHRPNCTATHQAFCILYDIFKLIPTPQSFLFYYNSRMSSPVSWLSLTSQPGSVRFAAFTTYYKNFKEKYFKIFVELDGRDFFMIP